VAYDLDRHDWRSFRLDRLTEPRGTGARFRTRELPTADAAEFVRAGVRRLWSAFEVEIVVHAPAATVREQAGRWAAVEAIDEQRCRLRMSVDTLDWPLLAVGALGAEFEVRSPPELTARVGEWADRFGRAAAR
jgi:predicted DNA-binding transcriptional regulator YafY